MKLTVREAARVLQVSETKIYRWIDAEEIPFVMIQHHPLFHRVDLLEWAIENELPLDADLYEHDHDRPLTKALERGGGRMLGDGLETIVADLPVGGLDRDVVRCVIAARQAEMFVCRADRIAIPRARSPIICSGAPQVMLWWTGPRSCVIDGVAVNALLLVVAPTVRDHLKLLSRLSRALHDKALAAAVRQPESFEQVIAEAQRFELALEVSDSKAGT